MAPDLAHLLTSWVVALRAERKSPATIDSYTRGVRLYIEWCDENGVPHVLDKAQVRAWVADLLLEHEPTTAAVRQIAVRLFSAWLTQEGELADDPLLGLKPPKQTTKVTRCLSEDECARLIKACSAPTYRGGVFTSRRDEALVRLLLETGLRAGEALGLSTEDVDVARGVLVVHRGKGGKGRVVSFGPQAARALDRYLRVRRSHKLAQTQRLWLGAFSQSLSYHGLRMALKQRAELAGIKDFHLHMTRHTFASRWLAKGGSEGALMATAGWSDRAMLDRYTAYTRSERAMDEARRLGLGDW